MGVVASDPICSPGISPCAAVRVASLLPFVGLPASVPYQALVSMQCSAPVCSLDLGKLSGFVVAGCMGGIVSVHALPGWSVLASTQAVTLLSSLGDAVKGKASTLGNAALSNIEDARGIAKDFAGEASSIVKVRRVCGGRAVPRCRCLVG